MVCVQIERRKQARGNRLLLEQELARLEKKLAAEEAHEAYCDQQVQACRRVMMVWREARNKRLDEAMALPDDDTDLEALFN